MLGRSAGPISRAIADVVDVVVAIGVTVVLWLGALVRFVIAPLRVGWPTPGDRVALGRSVDPPGRLLGDQLERNRAVDR